MPLLPPQGIGSHFTRAGRWSSCSESLLPTWSLKLPSYVLGSGYVALEERV